MIDLPFEVLSYWLLDAMLLGGILFIGLFNIIIYFARRRLTVHYYFGMLCVFYFIWYISSVVEFKLFPLHLLNAHQTFIISAISINRMVLFFNLYIINILDIRKPSYEKGLKLGANILFFACFFMPLSIPYTKMLIWLISLFNAVALLYLGYEVIKAAKKLRKNVRLINVVAYILVCMTAVVHAFEIQFHDKTMPLAFIMIALQAIILGLHYNTALIEVEQANATLEKTVVERTADLVQKEEETIQLIASISHDLRTPISVVGGYMELLQSDPTINETNQQYIANSLVRLLQMEKLTIDLFTLSQISDKSYTFQLERVNIAEIIKQIVDLYEKQAKQKGIALHIDTERSEWCIADKMRVMQVLDNLMMNALAYAKSSITISVIANDAEVKVIVSDDGSGINPSELPYVFDRFYKKRQRGSGLGLSNVRELVQRMNGEVAVESILQKGTSFLFTLPLASDA